MLPVVAGTAATTRQIFLYTLMVVAASLMLFAVVPMGWLYLVAAVVLGGGFVLEAARLRSHPERAMVVFRFSNWYLATLFVLMAVDRLVF
jgi:protoheme IX farnesyltransferase